MSNWVLGDGQIAVYRVTQGYTSSEVTWVNRSKGVLWAKQGGDFDGSTLLAQERVIESNKDVSIELPAGIIKDMIRNPQNNFGLIITGDGDPGVTVYTMKYHSSLASNQSLRPKLTIEFSGITSVGLKSVVRDQSIRVSMKSNILTISNQEESLLSMYSSKGSLEYQSKLQKGSSTVNFRDNALRSGLYVIKISNKMLSFFQKITIIKQ